MKLIIDSQTYKRIKDVWFANYFKEQIEKGEPPTPEEGKRVLNEATLPLALIESLIEIAFDANENRRLGLDVEKIINFMPIFLQMVKAENKERQCPK